MQGFEQKVEEYEFQQDNSSIHKSKLTMKFFENSEINGMDRAQTSILSSTCGTSLNVVLEKQKPPQLFRKNGKKSRKHMPKSYS